MVSDFAEPKLIFFSNGNAAIFDVERVKCCTPCCSIMSKRLVDIRGI